MIHIKEKIKCLNVLFEIKIKEKPLKFVSLPNQFMKNLYLVNNITDHILKDMLDTEK